MENRHDLRVATVKELLKHMPYENDPSKKDNFHAFVTSDRYAIEILRDYHQSYSGLLGRLMELRTHEVDGVGRPQWRLILHRARCAHCLQLWSEHVEGKCLWHSTHYTESPL